jgi:hypothetical protein
MGASEVILPLDGEGGPRRSRGSEGVKARSAFESLKVTHSTASRSPSPIKGEDGSSPEATS